MANPYYVHTSGVPATLTRGTSELIRQEFDSIGAGFDDVYAEITAIAAAVGVAVSVAEVDVASAATTDIGNDHGTVVRITGTTPITSFGTNYIGAIFLRFSGALVLTHSASLVCPGAANITTVANDACIAVPIGSPASGWRILAYCRMSLGLVDDVAVRTSSTYADPAWLTAVAWSKLTGTPTTIAGYGILDAPTKTGTGASGSWGINITGNAATATTAVTSTTAATETVSGVVELATTAEAVTGTDTVRSVTPAGVKAALDAYGPTLATAQATTSGTVIAFTSIPTWVKRITVMLKGVSTSGGSNIVIRGGVGGTAQTTGYTGNFNNIGVLANAFTTGFTLANPSAAGIYSGKMVLTRMGSNTWAVAGQTSRTDIVESILYTGYVDLSGALDSLFLTTVNGTDTFDSGSANIMYE